MYSLSYVDSSTSARGILAPTDKIEGLPSVWFHHILTDSWENAAGFRNDFGVKWSNGFTDTAFVINWHIGILYTIQLTADFIDTSSKQIFVPCAVL